MGWHSPLNHLSPRGLVGFVGTFLSQGCWTRCLHCLQQQGLLLPRGQEIRGGFGTTDASGQQSDKICRVCAEALLGKQIRVGFLIRRACGEEQPSDHWRADVIKWHRRKSSKLVCNACEEKGCSARDTQLYQCEGCNQGLGHTKFGKQSLYDKMKGKRRSAPFLCIDCESKIPCDACKKRFPKASWSKKELDNRKDQGSKLVCRICRDSGRTADEIDLYPCHLCNKDWGAKRFDKRMLNNYKYHEGQNKLICLACVELARQEENKLRSQKKSKVCCKCFCPTHRENYPLAPRYLHEKRWPDCDGCFSEGEKKFLDRLNPQPAWWSNAWGRKRSTP